MWGAAQDGWGEGYAAAGQRFPVTVPPRPGQFAPGAQMPPRGPAMVVPPRPWPGQAAAAGWWQAGAAGAGAAGANQWPVQRPNGQTPPRGPEAAGRWQAPAGSAGGWPQADQAGAKVGGQQAGGMQAITDAGGWQSNGSSSWSGGGARKWDRSSTGWQGSWSKDKSGWDSWEGADWQSSRSGEIKDTKEEPPAATTASSAAEKAEVASGPNPQWAFYQLQAEMTEQGLAAILQTRQELEVSVAGEAPGTAVRPITGFQELAGVMPPYLLTAMQEAGLQRPMPIQAQTLPFVLAGSDLVGIAKTGSGKTLAFLLPAVVHIEGRKLAGKMSDAQPVALVLAPVRELAVQIAEEANKLLWYSSGDSEDRGVGAVALYGGGARVRWDQVNELQKGWCHIIVATPGRACDFLSSQDCSLNRVSYFVLDEADRMLDGGFEEQMDQIAEAIRSDRQTLFFSATWPTQVQQLAGKMCRGTPVTVSIGQKEDSGAGPTTRSDIIQEVVVFDGLEYDELERQKKSRLHAHLTALLSNEVHKVLVFVNMKSMAWELAGKLNEEGYKADFMYGGRSQDSRKQVVDSFKTGEIKLLVTTDVMARGLDIPGISHVVVYDCYGSIDEYVHRIGRTARGPYGQGHALTFFEYDPKYCDMPAELIAVLEQAGQRVPPELRKIAEEVESGERRAKYRRKW
mmetsp:Transcript_16850/g.46448  ORF Transcript_16850/g.46448 Transcript_16850/m.46448 type:complete len:682 (-) Transcript_16850:76-2121(-)